MRLVSCWQALARANAGLLTIMLWLLAGRALAEPAAKSRAVLVMYENGDRLDEALSAALRELLARVSLTLADDDTEESALLARVRIETDADGATVRVVGRGSGRIDSTHRVHKAESDALFRETLAHVVLGAVEPLAVAAQESKPEQEQDGPTKQPEPASTPPQVPVVSPPPPATHYRVALGAGALRLTDQWSALLFARGDAYVATRLPSVFGITLGGFLPQERARAGVESTISGGLARVHAGIEPLIRRFVRLGLLLSAGADLFAVTLETARETARLASPRWRVDAVVGALGELRFPLRRGIELALAIGCDLDLTPRVFGIREGARSRTVFSLSRARPYAGLTLAWSSL